MYVYAMLGGSHGGQRKVLDPLELELQPGDKDAGNQMWVLWRSSKHSNASPAPGLLLSMSMNLTLWGTSESKLILVLSCVILCL